MSSQELTLRWLNTKVVVMNYAEGICKIFLAQVMTIVLSMPSQACHASSFSQKWHPSTL